MVNRLLVAAVLTAVLVSGCTSSLTTRGSLGDAEPFADFTWPPAERLGPDGALFQSGAPRFVEQLTPLTAVTQTVMAEPRDYMRLVTMSPPLAVDESGAMYVATLDQVQKSTDHGATWVVVLDFATSTYPGVPDRWETRHNALWMDAPTQTLYASFLGIDGCEVLFRSQDGAATWATQTPSDYPGGCASARGLDTTQVPITTSHTVFTGPHAGPLTILPRSAQHTFYWCEVDAFVGAKCSTSWDGGATFMHEALAAPPVDGCGTVSTGKGATRADGLAALPLGLRGAAAIPVAGVVPSTGSCIDRPPEVAYTTDGGLTWQVAIAPAPAVQHSSNPSLAFGPDGTAYLAYENGQSRIHLLRSRDTFATWEGPYDVTLPGHTLTTHPAVTVGDDGRVTVAYLATRDHQEQGDDEGELAAVPGTADPGTVWHLVAATSLDALSTQPTWYVDQVTPEQDIVHMGCVQDGIDWASWGTTCMNMGQATDIALDAQGRTVIARLDGCTPRNGCTGDIEGGYSHRDRQVMVAVLDAGTSLLAEHGVLPSLGLQHPRPLVEDDEVYHG